jgi:carbon-monoxide dehydrogenase large subunit
MKPMPLGMAIPTRDGSPMHRPVRPVLTSDRVRYVGDPVAIVVAETAVEARDAAEAVLLDVEPLPAVMRASEAAAPGAPQLHDEVPGNVAAEFHYGDAEKVAAAFGAAAHVTRLDIPNNRIVVCPMEPSVGPCASAARACSGCGTALPPCSASSARRCAF